MMGEYLYTKVATSLNKGRNITLEETTIASIERPKAANQTLKLTLD